MKGILYLCSVVAVLLTTVKADLQVCPESGQLFYAHPTSCSQFIECRDGELSVLDCMEGFHFDSVLGFCNFPEYVGCTLEDENNEEAQEENDQNLIECPETGHIFFAHPSVCSQFIECNFGEYREIDCIEGLHFNPTLGFCDLPENVGCELEDAVDEDSVEADGSGDDIDDGSEDDIGNGDGGDGEEDEGETDNGEGGGEGENGDDNEVDGDDGEVDVGEGDSEEGNGDDEVDGGEDDGEVDGSGEEEGGISEEGNDDEVDGEDETEDDGGNNGNGDGEDEEDIGGGDSGEGQDDDGDFACPASGQHWFPHPLRCSQFIECNNGLYTVVDCIEGLHFNPSLGWCDFPENIDCVDSTLPPPTTTTEVPNTGGPVGECPALNGQYVDFLTDSKYCDVFYKCNWGTPIQFTCQEPLHFNPVSNVCDWPQNVGCTLG